MKFPKDLLFLMFFKYCINKCINLKQLYRKYDFITSLDRKFGTEQPLFYSVFWKWLIFILLPIVWQPWIAFGLSYLILRLQILCCMNNLFTKFSFWKWPIFIFFKLLWQSWTFFGLGDLMRIFIKFGAAQPLFYSILF